MNKRAETSSISSYRELIAWQKSMELVAEVYVATQKFPDAERFGLTSQLRRAAVSIPCKFAEGQGRMSTGKFRQFLGHARGSLLELETQIEIAKKLGFLYPEMAKNLLLHAMEVGRILNGLIRSLPSNR